VLRLIDEASDHSRIPSRFHAPLKLFVDFYYKQISPKQKEEGC